MGDGAASRKPHRLSRRHYRNLDPKRKLSLPEIFEESEILESGSPGFLLLE
jgi:hypothetical protein